MATNSTTEGFIQRILFSSIVILYLCIGFVPNWGAVDKIATEEDKIRRKFLINSFL